MAPKARPASAQVPNVERDVLDRLGLRGPVIPVIPVAFAQGNHWRSTIRPGHGPPPRDQWANIADLGFLVPLIAALLALGVPPVILAQIVDAGAPAYVGGDTLLILAVDIALQSMYDPWHLGDTRHPHWLPSAHRPHVNRILANFHLEQQCLESLWNFWVYARRTWDASAAPGTFRCPAWAWWLAGLVSCSPVLFGLWPDGSVVLDFMRPLLLIAHLPDVQTTYWWSVLGPIGGRLGPLARNAAVPMLLPHAARPDSRPAWPPGWCRDWQRPNPAR